MIKKLKMSRTKMVVAFAILSVLVISMSGCTQEEVVAKVNDKEITKTEFYEQLVAQSGNEVLGALISEKIVELEIEKKDIVVTDDEIEKEIEKMREYYGGEEALTNALQSVGYSLDDVKVNIITNLQITKLLEPYITITDEEMETYFETNKASLKVEEQVKASHILVATKEEADSIKDKLNAGDDFAELAKEYSTDTSNSQSGGDLGYFGRGRMVDSFEDAAFSMSVDEISEPVKSDFGFHIIKVVDKKEAKEAVYEDFKDDIKDIIFEEKMGPAYQEWYQEKLGEYKITNTLIEE